MTTFKLVSYKELATLIKEATVDSSDGDVDFAEEYSMVGDSVDFDSVSNKWGAKITKHFDTYMLYIAQYGDFCKGYCITDCGEPSYELLECVLLLFCAEHKFDHAKICVEVSCDLTEDGTCSYCKRSEAYDLPGAAWGCGHCGNNFCWDCLSAKCGEEVAQEMLSDDGSIDEVEYPDCWQRKQEEAKEDLNERICKRCGSSVFLSDLPQYPFLCNVCDENMFFIETEMREPLRVEGSLKAESTSSMALGGDENCSSCNAELWGVPADRPSLCPECNEEVFPCNNCEYREGNCEDAIGCSYNQETKRCDRFSRRAAEVDNAYWRCGDCEAPIVNEGSEKPKICYSCESENILFEV